MAEDLIPVGIALGSNVGARERHLASAVDHLRAFISNLRVSRFLETAPVGVGEQPAYLNAAAAGGTRLVPHDLLIVLLDIERAHGRERPYPGAPRTLDLDLVLYGSAVIQTPTLRVPHPRFRERAFVLEPLAEVAPEMIDPETGRSVEELWTALRFAS